MKQKIFSLLKKYVFGPSDAQICEQQLKEYNRIEKIQPVTKIKYIRRDSLYRKIYKLMLRNRRPI